MESAESCEDIFEEPKIIHVLELVKDEHDLLRRIVGEQLKINGVDLAPKRRESRAKTRKSGLPATPATPSGPASLSEMVEEKLQINGVTVSVMIPKFLKLMIKFIKNYLDEEGLFRKAGGCARINNLIATLTDTEEEIKDDNVSVFDVCAAMKQLLRNLDDPLIPFNLHYVFLSCLDLPVEQRSESMLLAVMLLPKFHMHILFYLMQFLHEVTQHSNKNKMDAKNLAIVLTPNIMPVTAPPTKGGKESAENSSKVLIQKHVEAIKILIEVGDRMGIASNSLASSLVAALCKHSEDELENEGDGRKRRKRRSASLNRVFDFLRKKKSMKSIETPGTPFSPGIQTPVIKRSRKRSGNATPISTSTKNRILTAMQKKGLVMHNPIPGSGFHPSPGICMNPRPAVTEEPKSAQLNVGKGRSLRIRSNSHKYLQSSGLNRTKSGLAILPLAKSPRSRMPLCTTPSVPGLNPLFPGQSYSSKYGSTPSELASTEIHQTPGTTTSVETFSLTPMVREIDVLTLAALDEGTSTQKLLKGTEANQQIEMQVDAFQSHDAEPQPVQNTENGEFDGETNKRITRSRFKAETRRCQSFNEASRARRNRRVAVPRRKSDGTHKMRGRKTPSRSPSPLAVRPSKTTQSLVALNLNRSPSRCTLRRGRPNTMRAGLSRPSPSSNETSSNDITPINITLDRKGRVCRRIAVRPALPLPKMDDGQKCGAKEVKMVKPPRAVFRSGSSKLPVPTKKTTTDTKGSNSSGALQVPYVASKLKREPDGTVNMLIADAGPSPSTPSSKKARSCSLRSDMIRPSPTLKKPCFRGEADSSSKIPINTARPLRRGLSVQELVKKFDGCKDESGRNTFYTMGRKTNGTRLPLPDFGSMKRAKVLAPPTAQAPARAAPPVKPPRTSILMAEAHSSNTTTKILKSSGAAQFTTLTSTSNLGNGKGSKQTLKTAVS